MLKDECGMLNGDKDATGGRGGGHGRPANLREPAERRNRQAGGSAVAATTGLADRHWTMATIARAPPMAASCRPVSVRRRIGPRGGRSSGRRRSPCRRRGGPAFGRARRTARWRRRSADAEEQQRAEGERELLRFGRRTEAEGVSQRRNELERNDERGAHQQKQHRQRRRRQMR